MASEEAKAADGRSGEQGLDVLVHHASIGLKVSVRNHLHFLDENVVVYPCGHSAVIFNTESKEQTIINGVVSPPVNASSAAAAWASSPLHPEGITALAVPSNNRFIAVAEYSSERALVNVYDAATQRRRKVLAAAELGNQQIVSMTYSNDCKFLLVLGGAPDWTLVMWSADRNAKVLCTMKLSHLDKGGTIGTPSGASLERSSSFLPGAGGGAGLSASTLDRHVGEIGQVDFCPEDASIICASGNCVLRFLRVAEGGFRPVSLILKRELQNYTSHAWLPEDRVVIGCDTGELLLIENFEFRMVLPSANDGKRVATLKAYSKGFIAGCADGTLKIFDANDDVREYFHCKKVFRIEGVSWPIVQLAISPSEDSLSCSTENHQLFSFNLSSTDILKEDAMNFDLLTGSGFHGRGPSGSAHIGGMDTCIWKPLVGTCSQDKSVRIWQYQDRTIEIAKTFEEEPMSLAFHPSGLLVLVGFADKLRVLSLLRDDMRVTKEMLMGMCHECQFAHGGHMFAAASLGTIQIFDTYTAEMKHSLRGHSQKVVRLIWAQRDHRLVSVGKDGTIYLWDVHTGKRLAEANFNRSILTTAVLSGDAESPHSRLFVVSPDQTVRCLVASTLTQESQMQLTSPVQCMTMSPNGRVLFMGGCQPGRPAMVHAFLLFDGKLRAVKGTGEGGQGLPRRDSRISMTSEPAGAGGGAAVAGGSPGATGKGLNPVDTPSASSIGGGGGLPLALEVEAHVSHSSEMTCMSVSCDGHYVITGGEDGSICMFEAREVDARGIVRIRSASAAGRTTADGTGGGAMDSDEALVSKSELMAKKYEQLELVQKVEELKHNNDFELRQKDVRHLQKVKEVGETFQVQLDTNKSSFEALLEEKEQMEQAFEERLRSLQAVHTKERKERDATYAWKIEQEKRRRLELTEKRKAQNQQWDSMNAAIVEQHTTELNEVTAEYEAKTAAEQQGQADLHREKDRLQRDWNQLKTLIDQDADLEVEEVKQMFEQQLDEQRDQTEHLKGENLIMKKKYEVLIKEVKEQEDHIRALADSEKLLRETLKALEKDIQGHKKEIREREETIADKEKRIYDLKKKNQELEKFKFVLDYKIKELKRQIEPRENEIADMRKQVEEMDRELEQYHKSNSALDLMIGDLRLKMDGMQREVDSKKATIAASSAYIAKFRRDLQKCAASLDQHKQLKSSVRALYSHYVLELTEDTGMAQAGDAEEVQSEYNRQREHLEHNVEVLKQNISKDVALFLNDNARLMRESVGLTEEMNHLRREAKHLKRKHKMADLETGTHGAGGSGGGSSRFTSSDRQPVPPSGSRGVGHPSAELPGRAARQLKQATARELDMQRSQILALEEQYRALYARLGGQA